MLKPNTLPNFSLGSVLVVGDAMLDRYWHGTTHRISPEAPVPVVRIQKMEERPGGAGNVALNVSSLGTKTSLLALTGMDEAAGTLHLHLKKAGVTYYFESTQEHPTITKLRVTSHQQQLIRLDFEEPFTHPQVKLLLPAYETLLNEVNVVILSDYGKGISLIAPQLIALAKKKGKIILVDPKSKDFEIYRGATLITPNLAEFKTVVGACTSEVDLVNKGQSLIEQYHLEGLLITRGERGMTLLQGTHPPIHLPTQAKEVFDVTGAGDTVIAVMGAALASGASLEDAAKFANLAAGIVVGRLGAVSVTASQLLQKLNGPQSNTKIVSKEELQTRVYTAKAQNKTIIMTNGCFDLLHPGHTLYLEQAKALGHYLIVAVNSDVSVQKLKGSKRPINPLSHRMALLAGLSSVDWIVPFEEETPEQLIKAIRPDILVKGGDYSPEKVAGFDAVTRNGGKVVILPYLPGYSSSEIIGKIQMRQL